MIPFPSAFQKMAPYSLAFLISAGDSLSHPLSGEHKKRSCLAKTSFGSDLRMVFNSIMALSFYLREAQALVRKNMSSLLEGWIFRYSPNAIAASWSRASFSCRSLDRPISIPSSLLQVLNGGTPGISGPHVHGYYLGFVWYCWFL